MIYLDPRTRIIIVALISTAAIVIRNIYGLLLLLLLTLVYCFIMRLPIVNTIKKLRKFLYVFISLIFIQSIFIKGGNGLIYLAGFKILTTEGLIIGISIIIRMSIIILSAVIIASSGTLNIIYGLIAMKLPYEIAYMVLIAMKFLPMFKDEFTDSTTAIQLAGADLKKVPLRQKLSLYTYVLTPSVINSLRRAKYISAAMECRGFRAYTDRTAYAKLKMKGLDYFSIVLTTVSIVSIFYINRVFF